MDASRDLPAQNMTARLREFFYREEVPYGLALIRIILPAILLAVILPRWFHARELFSTDGAAAPLALNYGFENFPPEPGGTLAVALMTALVVTLLTSSIGWFTRASLCIAFAIYTYLNMLDCLSTMTKYSVISSHLLLLLSLSKCGSVWSVDAITGRCETRPSALWPQRLMQLLIGLVYLGAAFTKLHTGEFFTSDQLRNWMMTNVNNPNPLGEWLSLHPAVIVAMAHIAIIWQIAFIFVVLKPGFRESFLGLGVLFHFSTTPLLGLYVFPLVMTTSYLCYVNENDIRRLSTLLAHSQLTSRFARAASLVQNRIVSSSGLLASGATWGIVLLTSTFAGIAAEHSIDPYDLRAPSGPHALPVADVKLVSELQTLLESSAQKRIAIDDMILSMDIGTSQLGNVLITHEDEFQCNQQFFVQVTLTIPHPDLWLECRIENETGHTLDQTSQIVPRRNLRADWSYVLPGSLPEGTYQVVLYGANGELARRPISLTH